jgi:hypothetical protein
LSAADNEFRSRAQDWFNHYRILDNIGSWSTNVKAVDESRTVKIVDDLDTLACGIEITWQNFADAARRAGETGNVDASTTTATNILNGARLDWAMRVRMGIRTIAAAMAYQLRALPN